MLALRLLRAGIALAGLLVVLGLPASPPHASAAPAPQSATEVTLPRAHFYSQTGGDTPRPDDGFLVADRPGFGFPTGRRHVRFWTEFTRYGGVAIVGYPASRPFVWDGFDVQVFQKGVFQWRPEQPPDGRAWFMNVFDEFTRRGLDARLLAEKQVPLPGAFDDRGKTFEQIAAERLALLDQHPALLRQYRSVPDPLALYGLPNSAVQDLGPFYAVRLQRAGFQEWKVDAPGIARVGQVTVVNAGDLAKEYGLIPTAAAQPVPPPAPPSSQVAVYTPGREESVTSPFTVAGDAQAFEAVVLWELTDPQRGDVLGRGFAMALSCCEWSSFELEITYAVPRPLRATLAVWGSSGREDAGRPGEVRVPLDLQDLQRPAAAKDGSRLIEPLRLSAETSPDTWVITLRVRNESSAPMRVDASDFGLRDDATGALQWSDDTAAWDIGAGESRETALRFPRPGAAANAADLRLLHRPRRLQSPTATPVPPLVVDLPDPTPSR
ncbi:MAG TPA: Gmad2 immunoglobulin-like domain-containing protein [Chloroflexota bacterium]|nr:Gmad2 immunoglobulin-like domain-containing protein [Chloroflexota bacterium]